MRVRQRQRPGAFARVAGAIGETGAILGAIDLVREDVPLGVELEVAVLPPSSAAVGSV